MKRYALLWNPVTAPPRFRIWSWRSRFLRERCTESRLISLSAGFLFCGTRSDTRVRRKEPCLLPSVCEVAARHCLLAAHRAGILPHVEIHAAVARQQPDGDDTPGVAMAPVAF